MRFGVFYLVLAMNLGYGVARDRLEAIESFAVFYGRGQLEVLKTYDLVIIQPTTLTAAELKTLTNHGTLVLVYMSLGEVHQDDLRLKDGRIKEDWLIGENTDWASYQLDVRQRDLRVGMVALAADYLSQGFDGIFLDTVDTITVFPESQEAMQQLIRAMRLAFPEILLVQNRGLALIDELTDDIDALLVESAFSSYDFASGDYLEHPDDAVLGYLDMLADEELPLLTLDYAATAAEAFAIAEQARRAGYLPFVSTILLDDLPYDLSRDNGGRAETVRH